MKLFLDEDNGTGIPKALALVKMAHDEIYYASDKGHQFIKRGTKDRDWIPIAGEHGWLVFSQNKWMVNNEEERLLLVEHRVGVVYLDNGNDKSFLVMKLLLNKWDWLAARDTEIRPFAHLMSLSGHSRPLDLRSAMPLGRVKSAHAVGGPTKRSGLSPQAAPMETDSAVRLRLPGL